MRMGWPRSAPRSRPRVSPPRRGRPANWPRERPADWPGLARRRDTRPGGPRSRPRTRNRSHATSSGVSVEKRHVDSPALRLLLDQVRELTPLCDLREAFEAAVPELEGHPNVRAAVDDHPENLTPRPSPGARDPQRQERPGFDP